MNRLTVKSVFFKITFGGHKSFLLGHWYPCFGLLVTSPLGFKARVGSLIHALADVYVLHIPWYSPMVLHLLTFCGPAWQPSHSLPHTCEQTMAGLETGIYCVTAEGRCSTDWAMSAQFCQSNLTENFLSCIHTNWALLWIDTLGHSHAK